MRTFDQYRAEQSRLLGICAELETLGRQFAVSRTDVEVELGADTAESASALGSMVSEARRRLTASTIEVGIFGNVKRGKSTLVNALVGTVVSSTSVTPETAVPVWIEHGDHESLVIREDGSIEEAENAATAAEMATQRHRRRDPAGHKVVRVVQRLPIEWLPEGLRLVDTPGLDDPADAALYEELTLAELDRVAAAVFVFCSPPGPSGEELRLLRALAERGVDKAFLVCNFYPDHWNDDQTRSEMTEYIESVVMEHAQIGVQREDLRVYPLSGRDGFRAVQQQDDEAFDLSGVGALRSDLERFLSAEALPRLLSNATRRLRAARDLLLDAALERQKILTDPRLLEPLRREREAELAGAQTIVERLLVDTDAEARRIGSELRKIVDEPYVAARSDLEAASKATDVTTLERQLSIRLETAASRTGLLFGQRTAIHEERVRRRLYDGFGVTERLAQWSAVQTNWSSAIDRAEALPQTTSSPDWGTAAATGAATAVGGALVGGSLAGGVGIALLALGPVGWLIGAAAGGVLGLLVGTTGGAALSRGQLSDSDKLAIERAVASRRSSAAEATTATVESWALALQRSLSTDCDQFIRSHRDNVERIVELVGDERGRASQLREVELLVDRLSRMI